MAFAGIGRAVSSLFGSENEGTDAEQFQRPSVNRKNYEYGGRPDGAFQAGIDARGHSDYQYGKQAEYGGQQQNLYNRGNQQMDRGNYAFAQQGLARYSQQQMQEQMARRARGEMGSIAQMQADRQMAQLSRLSQNQQNEVAAQQASASAGARGPAALALAQQNAAANTAMGQQGIARMTNQAGQSISEAAQVNAAQEQLDAERAAFGAAGGIRSGDHAAAGLGYQSAGMAFGAGAQSGQLAVQNGQLGLQGRNLMHNINTTQLGANMAHENREAENSLRTMGIQAGVGGQDAQNAQQNSLGLVGMATSVAGAAAGGAGGLSDEAAKIPMPSTEPGPLPGPDHHRMSPEYWAARRRLAGEEQTNAALDRNMNAQLSNPGDEAFKGTVGQLIARSVYPERVKRTGPRSDALEAGIKSQGVQVKSAKPKESKAATEAKVAKEQAQRPGLFQGMADGFYRMAGAVDTRYRGSMDSDEAAKIPSFGPVGAALSGQSGLGYGARDTAAVTSGGGMDVMGTLHKYSQVPTGIQTGMGSGMYQKDPMGSGMYQKQPMGSGMYQKMPPSDEGAKNPTGVLPLYEPEGAQLHVNEQGRGELVAMRDQPQEQQQGSVPRASFTGPSRVTFQSVPDRAPAKGLARAKKKKDKPEDLSRQADEMLAGIQRDTAGLARAKPAVGGGDMASANRALRGYPYAYKPGLTPPEQEPGEMNVGPMAQQMAQNPITRTAVKRDPQTGLLSIDRDKFSKVQASGLASLQEQHDALARVVGRLKLKGGK